MEYLKDAALLTALINVVNVIGNLYWSFQLKGTQANREITWALKEQLSEKDAIIKDISTRKDEYKHQYQTYLKMYQDLKAVSRTDR